MLLSLLKKNRIRLGKSGQGLFLLGLFLSVLALANISSLHKAIHPNAGAPDHHCGVTLLNSGFVDVSAADVQPVSTPLLLVDNSPAEIRFFLNPSWQLPPGRGPPASLS